MAMLTCYLLWVPRKRVPKQCFATDAYGRGNARVPKRLYATIMLLSGIDPTGCLNCFEMVSQQTGISRMCVPHNKFSHTPLGEGGAGSCKL